MEALEGYDSSKGAISSYVIPRVKWTVQRECRASYEVIRKPEHLHAKHSQIKKMANRLEQVQDKPPTTQELALRINSTQDELESILLAFAPVGSLQAPLSWQDETALQDTIEDGRDYFGEIDLQIFRQQLRKDLDQLMKDHLFHSEQRAIKAYYGWDSGQQMTMEALGELMGITLSQCRSIINRSLHKLRRHINYLARKHPEIVTHQVYRTPEIVTHQINGSFSPNGGGFKKAMALSLFKAHACIGDIIQVKSKPMIIRELHYDHFIGDQDGAQHKIFYFQIYDIEIRSKKITNLYVH